MESTNIITSNSLIDDYLNKLYGDGCSIHTTKNYKIDLEMFVEYLQSKKTTITEATQTDLENYKSYLRNATYIKGKDDKGIPIIAKYSERTKARRITSLKLFYEYLYDSEIVERNPARKIKIPKIEKGSQPDFINLEESKLLLDTTTGETHEDRDQLILKMFLKTGMRLSELAKLDITDITGTKIKIRKGKGNKTRDVFVDQNFADEIERYIINRKYTDGLALFTSQKSNRMSVSAIQDLVRKYIVKAGLDPKLLHTHSLRHSFSVIMLSNKVDITKIQKALGHASLKTTQIYTHVLDEEMQETANTLGNLFD